MGMHVIVPLPSKRELETLFLLTIILSVRLG